jgi:hypothetical protein
MPLHDWAETPGWEGVHNIWIVELLRWVKPRLPPEYRAHIGSSPALSVGETAEGPDVAVRQWQSPAPPPGDTGPSTPAGAEAALPEPDEEVATITLDPQTALYVTRQGRLVAAVELVSRRNKDRDSARAVYLARYLGYLEEGAHLLLVDVHRRPLAFSFADALARELRISQPPCPAPLAVSYRVGEPAPAGGRFLAIWRRPLAVGQPLPVMPLPLTVQFSVAVDLEQTYQRAAADAYLA